MNMIDPLFHYTDAHHEQFLDRGYCVFDRFLTIEGLEFCQREVDAMLKEKLQPGRANEEVFSPHQQERWIWDLATQPQLLDMVEKQIGKNIVLWSSHLISKPPKSGLTIPWHQDAPYWNVSGPLAGAIWIAFDDIDASNGGMCILPQWHKKGTLPRQKTGESLFSEEIASDALPLDVEVLKVQYEFPAGSMATHDTMLPHTSEPNTSGRWRRVLVLRYMTATGEMGPKTYEDYRTGKPFNREFILVRGEDVDNKELMRDPFSVSIAGDSPPPAARPMDMNSKPQQGMKPDSKVIWSATPTPFLPDGSLDEEGVHKLIEQHQHLGVSNLFLAGSTGEGMFMPDNQREQFVRLVKQIANNHFHLAVQVSDHCAARVQENIRRMEAIGVDSVVVAPAPASRFTTPSFLRRYFFESLEAASVPIGLYVMRPPMGPTMPLDLWREVAEHPSVRFIKDSASFEDFSHMLLEIKKRRPEVVLLTGNEFNAVSAIAEGYDGVLAGTGILIGGLLRRAMDSLDAGDRAAADSWQKQSNECLWGIFGQDRSRWIPGLKYAMKYLGIFQDTFAHITGNLGSEEINEIELTCERFREYCVPTTALSHSALDYGESAKEGMQKNETCLHFTED